MTDIEKTGESRVAPLQAAEAATGSCECETLRKQVDLMARTLQYGALGDRDAMEAIGHVVDERDTLSEMLRGMARRVGFERHRSRAEFSAKQRHFHAYNNLMRLMSNAAGFSGSVTPDQIAESLLRRRADTLALRIERDELKARLDAANAAPSEASPE